MKSKQTRPSGASAAVGVSRNDQGRERKTDFCKFCYDAGKTGWDNHSFRNAQNQICCPYLLNDVKCGYCKKEGHTTKYCPKNLKKNKNEFIIPATPPVSKIPTPQKSVLKPMNQNQFGALTVIMEEEDEESLRVEEQAKQFPLIMATAPQRVPTTKTRPGNAWSAVVASKPPQPAPAQPAPAPAQSAPAQSALEPTPAAKPAAQPAPAPAACLNNVSYTFKTAASVTSWSDFMDDEEDN